MSKHYSFVQPPEMTSQSHHLHPVVIAGGGPVGLTLALTLALHRIPCVLLEGDSEVCKGSRALGMSRRTLEIWDALDAVQAIHAHGRPWNSGRTFLREQEILRFHMPDDERLKFRPMFNIQQCHTEQYLVDALAQHSCVDLRWQHHVQGVQQHDGHVELEVETPAGPYRLYAQHVVACDGARSTIRGALGLRLEGSTHDASYLIADIALQSDALMERRCWFDAPTNPGSTVLMHGQPDGVWRLDFQLQKGEDQAAAQDQNCVKERIARHLAYIGETGAWSLLWTSLYRAHNRSLRDFRQDRVFFAGDAAHLMPIFGIRGLNSGVEDAWNLGWKLAHVHQRKAGNALLDSYSVERRAVFLENAALADRNASFMTPASSTSQLLRDAVLELVAVRPEMADIVNPRQASYVPLRNSPLDTPDLSGGFTSGPAPGEVLPNLRIPVSSSNEQAVWLQDFLGPDWTGLLFVDEIAAASELIGSLNALGQSMSMRLVIVTATVEAASSWTVISDLSAQLCADFGAGDSSFYLVRPDHNIAARWMRVNVDAVRSALMKGQGFEERRPSEAIRLHIERSGAEQIYRTLCAALDGSGGARDAVSMARLAMLFAIEIGNPDRVARLAREALGPNSTSSSSIGATT
jgi:3-(3-hydroxy-phenyl)propionate hydroxylase